MISACLYNLIAYASMVTNNDKLAWRLHIHFLIPVSENALVCFLNYHINKWYENRISEIYQSNLTVNTAISVCKYKNAKLFISVPLSVSTICVNTCIDNSVTYFIY